MAEVDYPRAVPSEPFSERRNPSSSPAPSYEQRIDSGVQVSPVSGTLDVPTPTCSRVSFDNHYVVYPPLITGHGRLVRGRQTVPAWMGALIVVGGFSWMVGCALYV